MGYDELNLALMNAWERAQQHIKHDPEALAWVMRRREMSTYTRPLRSWSLVLRANDKRITDDNSRGMVTVDAGRVRVWCSPVVIRCPGVSLDEAARRFGVNRTTVLRWASPTGVGNAKGCTWWQDVRRQMRADGNVGGRVFSRAYRVSGCRLELEHFCNAANPKRSETRVWTPGFRGLDPGGEVWSGDWGALRVGLAERVSAGFGQVLERVDRRLGGGAGPQAALRPRVWQWVCPAADGGCGRRAYKLYLPLPNWTLMQALGG